MIIIQGLLGVSYNSLVIANSTKSNMNVAWFSLAWKRIVQFNCNSTPVPAEHSGTIGQILNSSVPGQIIAVIELRVPKGTY